MSKILILGATGTLGNHVTQYAVSTNHEISVLVRSSSGLPNGIRDKVVVYEADIAEMPASELAAIFRTQDAVINTAGYVPQGRIFTDLIDHIVTSLESLPEKDRPVCWLAGAFFFCLANRVQSRKSGGVEIKSRFLTHFCFNFSRFFIKGVFIFSCLPSNPNKHENEYHVYTIQEFPTWYT